VVIQITAFGNQNNLKNATAFFTKAGSAKAALNKAYPFLLFALVTISFFGFKYYLSLFQVF